MRLRLDGAMIPTGGTRHWWPPEPWNFSLRSTYPIPQRSPRAPRLCATIRLFLRLRQSTKSPGIQPGMQCHHSHVRLRHRHRRNLAARCLTLLFRRRQRVFEDFVRRTKPTQDQPFNCFGDFTQSGPPFGIMPSVLTRPGQSVLTIAKARLLWGRRQNPRAVPTPSTFAQRIHLAPHPECGAVGSPPSSQHGSEFALVGEKGV